MTNEILKRFDLRGKVAAVTGGGGELCGAMADALGAMGVAVAVLDLNLAELRGRSQHLNFIIERRLVFPWSMLGKPIPNKQSRVVAV